MLFRTELSKFVVPAGPPSRHLFILAIVVLLLLLTETLVIAYLVPEAHDRLSHVIMLRAKYEHIMLNRRDGWDPGRERLLTDVSLTRRMSMEMYDNVQRCLALTTGPKYTCLYIPYTQLLSHSYI